jgi:hypothetical protein
MREQSSRCIGAGDRPLVWYFGFLVSIYILKWADPFNFSPKGKVAKGKEKAQHGPTMCFYFPETPDARTESQMADFFSKDPK